MSAAFQLVEEQVKVADRLDKMQEALESRMRRQVEETSMKRPEKAWLDLQRFCTALQAEIIVIRGSLDRPLQSEHAYLQELKDVLSRRWGVRMRLEELGGEIDRLQESGRNAEELRVFHIGKFAAGLALCLVVADALAGRLKHLVSARIQKDTSVLPDPMTEANAELMVFGAVFLLTGLGWWLILRAFRRPARRSN